MVQQGAGIFCRGSQATEEDVTLMKTVTSAIFPVMEEIPQSLFNAATALSGSGPAYVSDQTALKFESSLTYSQYFVRK